MQCVKLLKKRALDLDPRDFCKTKRMCLGAELVECPMETSDSSNVTNQLQPVQKGQLKPSSGSGPGLLCQRCLRGEPGHIKHILGQF